jgi:hypothetical protein
MPRVAIWLALTRLFIKRLWGGPTPFEVAVIALIAEIRRRLHLAITEHLMTLTLSNITIEQIKNLQSGRIPGGRL